MDKPRISMPNKGMSFRIGKPEQSFNAVPQVISSSIRKQNHTSTPVTSDATLVDDTVALVDDATALVGGQTASFPTMRSTIRTVVPSAKI